MLSKSGTLILCLGLLVSCKTVEEITGNTPIVDTEGVNMARYESDLADCQAYADEVQVARKTTSGAVGGAVVGSIFGAVLGNSSTASRGAGIGAVGGGARGLGDGLHEREVVIKRCLQGRGYRVLN